MTSQLSLSLPAAPEPPSAQLEIPETGTNMAFRFGYQVPEFSKSGKLIGFRLEYISISNVISKEDLYSFYGCTQKFMDGDNGAYFMKRAQEKIAQKFNLTADQATFMKYTGYNYCEHRPCTKVDINSPIWV